MIPKKVNSAIKSYESYKYKDNPKHPKYLDKKEYKKLIRRTFELIMKEMILTGDKVVFPTTLGAMQVVKFKRKPGKLSIDFNATKKAGKLVRHRNYSTDGWWPRVHWYKKRTPDNKYGTRFKHARNYFFKVLRANLRPNSYNKTNPEVSLYPHFRKVGHEMYLYNV